MNLAGCLLLYSLVISVLGPPGLSRLTHSGLAPRLGMLAWATMMGSVLAAWPLAVGMAGTDLLLGWRRHVHPYTGCLAALRVLATGRGGPLVQAGLLTLVLLGLAALAVLGLRMAAALRQARVRTRDHARTARLLGRPGPSNTIVLDSPHGSVYCVSGRPSTIVVTRGALDTLNPPQLAAVLAHERAHLNGHHHLTLAVTRALARLLPAVRLFTEGAAEVARLLEMRADDAAARRHGSEVLVDALLALVTGAGMPRGAGRWDGSGMPSGALGAVEMLGASGTGVLDRVERLITPPSLPRLASARLALSCSTLALLAAPTALLVVMLTTTPLCAT